MRTFPITCFLALAVSSTIPAQDAAKAPTPELPRYRLEPGQKLVYRMTSEGKFTRQSRTETGTWTIWVTRRNADGSCRLVSCAQTSSRWTQDGKEAPNAEESTDCAWCDVFPDGRMPSNDSLRQGANPSALFPRLPRDAAEMAKGWSNDDGDGVTTSLRVGVPNDLGNLVLTAARHGAEDAIYLSSHAATATFERKRGLVVKAVYVATQGYGFVGTSTGTTTLEDAAMLDAGEIGKLAADFDACFAAIQTWTDRFAEAGRAPARLDALMAAAKDAVVGARTKVTHPVARKLLDDRIAAHDDNATSKRESVEQRVKLTDKPSPEWETTDLEGKKHSIKSHAGEVMVLDFWYRGCGWCIKAMPQVKAVAEHFKGKPVAVLGMSTDGKVEDAQLVADKMGLTYPTLRARGIPEKYGIRGFPTLVIVDAQGVVRDWHVGYSPTLRDDVIAAVEKLLPAAK